MVRAAAMARRTLIGTPGILPWGRELRIDWAIPEEDVDEYVMSQVCENHLYNFFFFSGFITIYICDYIKHITQKMFSQFIYSFVGDGCIYS